MNLNEKVKEMKEKMGEMVDKVKEIIPSKEIAVDEIQTDEVQVNTQTKKSPKTPKTSKSPIGVPKSKKAPGKNIVGKVDLMGSEYEIENVESIDDSLTTYDVDMISKVVKLANTINGTPLTESDKKIALMTSLINISLREGGYIDEHIEWCSDWVARSIIQFQKQGLI